MVKDKKQIFFCLTILFVAGILTSSILMLFYHLAPLQNDNIRTSRCMQFTFGDEREVYLLDDSALPVTEKEVIKNQMYTTSPFGPWIGVLLDESDCLLAHEGVVSTVVLHTYIVAGLPCEINSWLMPIKHDMEQLLHKWKE